jgi:hypothetical protein
VVELLVVFHRTCDAVVLVFPMAWALSPAVPRSQSLPVLLTSGLFFFPSGNALNVLDRWHFIPAWLSSGTIWQVFILPYQAWALLIMAGWPIASSDRRRYTRPARAPKAI